MGFVVREEIGELLALKQPDYAESSACGAEAVAYTARRSLQNAHRDRVVLKLDFENGFNCPCRDKMLKVVDELALSLLP